MPLITSACMTSRMPAGDGPPHRPDGPSCPTWPVRASRLRLHGPGDPLPRLRRRGGSPIRRFGEGTPIVFGPRWVSPPRGGVGRSPPARVLRARSRRPIASCASIASAAGSRRASSSRGRPSSPESRQLEAVIDAVGEPAIVFASSCCCLAASQLAVRRPEAVVEARLLRRLRLAQRHPGGDEAVADRVHPHQLDARRADARRAVRPARERRRDRRVHAHAAARPRRPRQRRSSSSSTSTPTCATCCRRSRRRRSCCTAAATAPCRSAAGASWRRCCRTRGSSR